MNYRWVAVLTVALLLRGGASADKLQAMNPEVRVWLTRWQSTPIRIVSDAPCRLTCDGRQQEVSASESVLIERSGSQIIVQIQGQSMEANQCILQGEAPFTLSNASSSQNCTYRGSIVLRIYRGRLQVLNVLPLEDYLLGVVPLEMPPNFPSEALKAQAIAARSWTVRNRLKHEADGADVCDSTHCQVYGGMSAERESTTVAVRSTAGQILTRNNTPVDATYTADCGGQPVSTNDAEPLPRDTDEHGTDYCAANPRHHWSLGFTFLEVWQAMAGKDSPKDAPNGDIDVQIVQTDAGNRVVKLRLRWGDRVREVSSAQLRSRLLLPSTLFSVRVDQGNTIVFEGSGSGHGSGLCQWGAAGRARSGQSVEQILQAYYPGARILPLSEAMWEWQKNKKTNSVR